jgi:carboxypeptidase Q
MKIRFLIPTLFGLAAMAAAQTDPATVAKIIDEGKNHSQVMPLLTQLAGIGARLTSSTRLEKAEKWAMGQFKSFGCANVHLEAWGSYPVGFDRGTHGFGRMVSPDKIDFEYTSPSWSEGTNGPLRGPAVRAPKTMEEYNSIKDKLKGAWVVSDTPFFGRRGRPGQPAPELTPEQKMQEDINKLVADAGIAGRVSASRNELCVTSGNYRDKTFENHPMDRQVTVRKSDMDKIMASLTAGKPVELEFNLDQKFRKGPITNYNVIAEIPGTEKPDEVVIVSGHLDSWDGPGSQGALDNGTGSCTTLEAARILCKSGAKPKRTIRFILWTGEEQGLFGSRGYVQQHLWELDMISAILVDDGGTDYQGGYDGAESMRAMMTEAYAPVVAAFPDLPEKFTTRTASQTRIGSDQDSFNDYAVPGFFTIEAFNEKIGPSDYTFIHHTQHDRIDKAIAPYLVQSGTNHAAVSYYLACAPTLLPRFPKPDFKGNPNGVPGLMDILKKKG